MGKRSGFVISVERSWTYRMKELSANSRQPSAGNEVNTEVFRAES
jgi:hypothetical protein